MEKTAPVSQQVQAVPDAGTRRGSCRVGGQQNMPPGLARRPVAGGRLSGSDSQPVTFQARGYR
jgi:hypothetical protein